MSNVRESGVNDTSPFFAPDESYIVILALLQLTPNFHPNWQEIFILYLNAPILISNPKLSSKSVGALDVKR